MLLTLFLIVLFGLLVTGGCWWLFQQTPQKRWRDQAVRLWWTTQQYLTQQELDQQSLTMRQAAEKQALCVDALRVLLTSISVNQLDAYTGIGPVTISKLRDAGYEDLAALQDLGDDVPGLGGKRLADITEAVQDLTRQVRSQFESGAFPGAVPLGHQLTALRREHEDAEACGRARLQAARVFAKQLELLVPTLRQITIVNYLRSLTGKGELPLTPATPLPDLESTLQAAETQARAEIAARRQAPAAIPVAAAPAAIPVAPSAGVVMALQGPARLDAELTGVAPTPVPAKPPAAQPKRQEPHQVVLELDPLLTPTADLIRRQYHLLQERYDPEKLRPFGPDFVQLAQSKRDAVRTAATALLAELGEPLAAAPPPASPQELRHNPDLDALFGV